MEEHVREFVSRHLQLSQERIIEQAALISQHQYTLTAFSRESNLASRTLMVSASFSLPGIDRLAPVTAFQEATPVLWFSAMAQFSGKSCDAQIWLMKKTPPPSKLSVSTYKYEWSCWNFEEETDYYDEAQISNHTSSVAKLETMDSVQMGRVCLECGIEMGVPCMLWVRQFRVSLGLLNGSRMVGTFTLCIKGLNSLQSTFTKGMVSHMEASPCGWKVKMAA